MLLRPRKLQQYVCSSPPQEFKAVAHHADLVVVVRISALRPERKDAMFPRDWPYIDLDVVGRSCVQYFNNASGS